MNEFSKIKDLFLIGYNKSHSTSSMSSNHYHDAYEIYYLLSGQRYYFIKNRTYHILRGDLVFIPKNELHKTFLSDIPDHERILINFKTPFIESLTNSSNDDLLAFFGSPCFALRLSAKEQIIVEGLLKNMLNEYASKSSYSNISLKLTLGQLLVFINRTQSRQTEDAFTYPTATHKKILEIVEFINNNFEKNLSLDEISKKYYLSRYHLCRSFKLVTGFGYSDYLNTVRIKEAKRLLLTTDLHISAISERVGYESATHFGRSFKKITSLSPLKYRRSGG